MLRATETLSVSVEPKRVEVDVGKSVTFNCTVTGTPVTSIYWLKDRRPLIIDAFESIAAESKRIFVQQPYALSIRSVNREDAGMYQCVASNDFESAQASSELRIGDIAAVIVSSFEDIIVEPSSSVSMRCIATGAPLPQIVWRLDDNQIPNAVRFRVGDYVTTSSQVVSYMNISSAQVVDGGEYKCIASNEVASAVYSGRLNVVGPPTVRPLSAPNITVVSGNQVVLRCPVIGYPLNSLKWEHNGHTLPINHRQKVEQLTQNGYGGQLRIDNIQRPTDEGDYSCIAKGSKTSAKGSVRVTIKVAPVIDAQPLPERVFANEAMRVKLVCSVIQGDPPVDIKWYKEDMILVSSRYVSLQNSEDYSLLTFKRVSFEDRGNYTCEARNDVESVNRTSQLVVNVPPRWAIEPSDSFVVRGSSLSVDCQAEGFPVPRIRWTKAEGSAARNFKSIVSSPHLHVYENGSLAVHDSRDADGGFYLCQASNGIGSGLSKVVKITVHVAAHFKSKFTAEMVVKGLNIRLKCEAFGNLPIAITWSKDKQKIDGHAVSSGNFAIGQGFSSVSADNRYEITETVEQKGVISEIFIKKADRRDSALFTCLASNAYGYDDTNIQLMVQEPPDPPQDIMIVEITSRSVKLAWSPPYSGNSPISNYYIQYRNALEAHKIFHNVSIQGSESFGQVTGLKPAVMYMFTLIAENRIGRSEPSRAVEAISDEEAPGGPPINVHLQAINAKAIKVTWKPPNKDLQYGTIKGYYIGYKQVGTSESFIYKTLEVQEKFKEEAIISGLKRHSKYAIIVQAFNNKGAGPSTEESNVQTLEMDPPQTPQLHIASTSTSSIHLTWEPNADESNPIDGYLLYQRKESPSEWREIRLQGRQTSYIGLNLSCGTRYQFHLIAYNRIGRGDKSDTLTVKTDGSVPVAPDRQSVVSVNSSTAMIHLDAWHHGGCVINNFKVRYRLQGAKSDWTEMRYNNKDRQLELQGLQPAKKYNLQITAYNEVGFTGAEYSFSTLSQSLDELGVRSSTKYVRGGHKPVNYQLGDYSVVIPVIISTLVIFILLIVVCIVVKKGSGISTSSSLYSAVIGRKQDSLQMTSLAKNGRSRSLTGHETLPKMNGDCAHNQGHMETEPLYATVKRTPRPPR
ncbi:Down syndrome cell adhesion molecule-like protein Dscam2, partial [Leptotrombidium deliense]